MKKIQRLQFILSPVLIAILSVLLVVVSFSWYQAAVGEIQFESQEVSITVEEPEGTSVDLTPIGDEYVYDSVNKTYTVTRHNPLSGYFGQTGQGDLDTNNNDKPYIAFYSALIVSDEESGITINDCYVKGIVITKNDEELENEEYLSEIESEFTVEFYTLNSENVFSNPQNSFTLEEGTLETIVYIGIKFLKSESLDDFKFSDISYYGSLYSLEISFYNNKL